MFLDPLVDVLRSLGVPMGGLLIGVALGAGAFAAIDWMAHRRPRGVGRREGIDLVDGPQSVAGAVPDPRPIVGVAVHGPTESRTVYLRGAGASPNVPLPRARGFLLILVAMFAVISAVQLWFFADLYKPYDRLVGVAGTFLFWPRPWPGVYAVGPSAGLVPDFIFPMYVAAIAALIGASALVHRRPGLGGRRVGAAVGLLVLYAGVEVVLDAVFFTVPGESVRNLAVVVRTLTGGVFLAFVLLCLVVLPSPRRVRIRFRPDPSSRTQFAVTAAVALAIAVTSLVALDAALGLASFTLPFTLLLLLPLATLETFIALNRPLYFRQLRRRRLPPISRYHPSVSIVMPAYNEAQWIGRALALADAAAAKYPGPVEVIVGNDGSTDRTSELARTAIASFRHARGSVVDLPHGGKSNALNGALALATGEIVLRLDADTFISPALGFGEMVRHFADPEVGGVQGAVLPRQRRGWIRKRRALELAWGHYFLRPALMGVRSGEVIDGLFSAFRRKDLVALGGWVPWNGEDTEISLRVQRLGYRVRIEYGARAYEDVPATYAALRRQRVRWARGIVMANGQHYPALVGPTPEFAGFGVLYWFLTFARSGVRSLVYLFLGLLLLLGVLALVDVAYLLVIATVMRGIPLAYFLGKMRRWDVLAWIPFFPIASVIKQSFRFESFGLLGPEAAQEYH